MTRAARFVLMLLLVGGPLIVDGAALDLYDAPRRAVMLLALWFITTAWARERAYGLGPFLRLGGSCAVERDLVCILLLCVVPSCLWAVNPGIAQAGAAQFALGIVLLLAVADLFRQHVRVALQCGVAGALLVAFVVLVQAVAGEFWWYPAVTGPGGTFGNRNLAAQYMALLFAAAPRRIRFVLGAAILVTGTRSAIAAVLLILWIELPSWQARGYAFLLALQVWVLTLCGPPRAINHRGSVEWRLAVWRNTSEMMFENSTGVGVGNWGIQYPRYHTAARPDPQFNGLYQATEPHNDLLQWAAEVGIGVIVLLPGVCVVVFSRFQREFEGDAEERTLILCAVAYTVEGLLAFPAQRPLTWFWGWVLLGLLKGVREWVFVGVHRKEGCPPRFRLAAGMLMVLIGCTGGWLTAVAFGEWDASRAMKRAVFSDNYAQVIADLEHATHTAPHDYRPYLLLGSAAFQGGDLELAHAAARAALRCHPNHSNVWRLIGDIEAARGRGPAASVAYRRADRLLSVGYP